MKVLIAEDDDHIRSGLVEILETEGYQTVAASRGPEALELYVKEKPDFICLDIMLPGKSGYDVCREVRKLNPTIPIVFISAKSEEIDKVLGLELGADDFITKPFGVKEVVARIRAVTRRYFAAPESAKATATFSMGDLTVYPGELRARRGEETIELSLRDLKILELLFRNAGQVVSRDLLYTTCWGVDHVPSSRTVDQHVYQLRKRIELDPGEPTLIKTVHGVGYRYDK
jgi:two-component system alkaline phosphatase synthesis response regulator PhoP